MSIGKYIATFVVELKGFILHESASHGVMSGPYFYILMLAVSFVSSLFLLNNSFFYEMSKVRKGVYF